jgi:hypothetical protein
MVFRSKKTRFFFLSLWHNRGVQAAQGQEIRPNREEVVVGESIHRTVGFSCFTRGRIGSHH